MEEDKSDPIPEELDEYTYMRRTSMENSNKDVIRQIPVENEEQTDEYTYMKRIPTESNENSEYTYMRRLPGENEQQTEEYTNIKQTESDTDDMDYNYSYTGRNSRPGESTDDMDNNYSYTGRRPGENDGNMDNYLERSPDENNDDMDPDYNYSYPIAICNSQHVYSAVMEEIPTAQNFAYNNGTATNANQGHFAQYDHNNVSAGNEPVHVYEPVPAQRRGSPVPYPHPPPYAPQGYIQQPTSQSWQLQQQQIQVMNMPYPQPAVSMPVQDNPSMDDQGLCPTIFAVIAIVVSVLFSCCCALICSIPAIVLASNASTWSANGHLEKARKYRKWSFGCSLATVGFTVVAWISFAAFLAGIICTDGTC